MYKFCVVESNKEHISKYAGLLALVFKKPDIFTNEYIDWEYASNPIGQIVGFDAYYEGQLAAHYVAQPIISRLNDKEVRGLLSLNTATHPEHQGKKLFTTLADKTYELAANQGYRFVIGVSNANSTHGFVNKLGFQLVGPLHAKIGLGKIKYNGGTYAYSWERIWNKELLKWRLSRPNHYYQISNDMVLAPTGILGIKAIIGEFSKKLLIDTLKNDYKLSFNPLKLWVGIDKSVDWGRSLFYNIPRKFRPAPLNLIFKDLTGNNLKLNIDEVKFQGIDFDAY